MPTRKTVFANGEFYHVYNRGVDKRIIFSDKSDVDRFFQCMVSFNSIDPVGSLYELSLGGKDKLKSNRHKYQLGGETAKLVNIVAYCLNPNHFHFILEQVRDGGISEFMKRMGGYTWYFNNKYKRSGSLFQGVFKSIHIDSNEYLLHVSAYVNLNNRVHKLGGETAEFAKFVGSVSSWEEYIGEGKNGAGICTKDIILEQFKGRKEYKEFAMASLRTIRERKDELKGIKGLLLE
ncbi:MAG: transposase [Candidatus Paceibacterota bacterium]|jgi:putative transposase